MSADELRALAVPCGVLIQRCGKCDEEVCDVNAVRVSYVRGLPLSALHQQHACEAKPAPETATEDAETPARDIEPPAASTRAQSPKNDETASIWNGDNESPSRQREARKCVGFGPINFEAEIASNQARLVEFGKERRAARAAQMHQEKL